MAGRKITVVVSQAPGKNPVKRHLEEEIATRLMISGSAEVSIVPHLYDLSSDHTGMLWLKSLKGDLVVLGWLYPRAIRWVLDRNGVKGKVGDSRLNHVENEDDEESDEEGSVDAAEQGIGAINVPDRLIYAIDLRNDPDPQTYITEIERLAALVSIPLVQLSGLFGNSLNGSATNGSATNVAHNGTSTNGKSAGFIDLAPTAHQKDSSSDPTYQRANGTPILNPSTDAHKPAVPAVIGGGDVRRRWYPVIDYSRCTNCLECLDFCLFGVYGVDLLDRILVEQEDNCKKGCPACSRVCPANAIVFPEHKTPAIAGAEGAVVEDFKIDLSKLFGAPSALEMAVLERDTELVADGREAVGASVGLPKRQSGSTKPRDEFDDLLDGLDAM